MTMTDGNTATTSPEAAISPTVQASEDSEMIAKVREFFDRGINALVNQSELSKQVSDLQAQVQELMHSTEKYRQRNEALDETLYAIRKQRDEALASANIEKAKADNALFDRDITKQELDKVRQDLVDTDSKLSQLKVERDDAQMKALELEDDLAKARAKLEKFLSLADEIDPPQEQGYKPDHDKVAGYQSANLGPVATNTLYDPNKF